MRLNVLGNLTVTSPEGETWGYAPAASKERMLLASLALTKEPITKEVLYQRIWGDDGAGSQRSRDAGLRTAASTARREILRLPEGPARDALEIHGHGNVRLHRPDGTGFGVSSDHDLLRELLDDLTATPERVREALALVRGTLLGSFDAGHYPWLAQERKRLTEDLCVLARRYSTRTRGDVDPVVHAFLAEPAGSTLLDALHRAGFQPPTDDPPVAVVGPDDDVQPRSVTPARRLMRWQTVLLGALAAAVVVAAAAALYPNDGEPDGADRPRTTRVVTIASLAPPPGAPVAMRMKGINTTYKPRWGREVTADATDELSFETRIENRTGSQLTGPLLYVVTCTTYCGSGSAPLALRASVVDRRGKTLATSNRVHIDTQSDGFQRFVFGDERSADLSEVFDSGIGVSSDVASVPTRQIELLSPYDRVVKVFRIGDLEPNRVRRLRFNASWDIGATGQLSAGPSKVRIGTRPWEPRLTVSTGQIVTVGVLLDNAAYSHPWTANVHVRFKPDSAAGTVDILTEARLAKGHDQAGPQPTGHVTLQSAGTGPIDLRIVPGTTSLWGKCRPGVCVKGGDRLRLPEGLTTTGIRVGPLGGFVPRDKHHGTQFTRYLIFKVRVVPLTKP